MRVPPPRIHGYVAAHIQIENMLNAAEKDQPNALPGRFRRTASYRQGYYDGLLAAHCMSALGEYPEHPENASRIEEILATNHKGRTNSAE